MWAGKSPSKSTKSTASLQKCLINAGVDPITAERDARRIEHVISESSFQRLKKDFDRKEATKESVALILFYQRGCTFLYVKKAAIKRENGDLVRIQSDLPVIIKMEF